MIFYFKGKSSSEYYKQHLIHNSKTWNDEKEVGETTAFHSVSLSSDFLSHLTVVSLTSDTAVTSVGNSTRKQLGKKRKRKKKRSWIPFLTSTRTFLYWILLIPVATRKRKIIYNICLMFYLYWKLWATWNS